MKTRKWIVMVWILVILVLAVAASYMSYLTELYLPAVYNAEPSVTPTLVLTPTSVLESEWIWIATSGNVGGELWVYAVVPGIEYELKGMKVGKTVYVTAYCPDGISCMLEPMPPEFPPPCEFWPRGRWCQIEKLKFPTNAKQACGTQYPYNCKDAR